MGTVKTLLILGMSAILLSACLGVQPVPAATSTSPAPTQPAATVGPTSQVTSVDAKGAALSFSRNGGIAGFCDKLVVYRDGRVMAENCKDQRADFRLNAAQLALLYDWLDTYQHTEYNQSDPPGVADGMSVTLTLEGTGQKTAGEDALRAMTDFASSLTMQAK
jgi:hypothetical protein